MAKWPWLTTTKVPALSRKIYILCMTPKRNNLFYKRVSFLFSIISLTTFQPSEGIVFSSWSNKNYNIISNHGHDITTSTLNCTCPGEDNKQHVAPNSAWFCTELQKKILYHYSNLTKCQHDPIVPHNNPRIEKNPGCIVKEIMKIGSRHYEDTSQCDGPASLTISSNRLDTAYMIQRIIQW
jgi:hypothetical protein